MFNQSAQKNLRMVLWSTNVIGALCMGGLVFGAYQANRWFDRERESVETQRRDDLALLARAEQVHAVQDAAAKQVQAFTEKLAGLRTRIPTTPKEAEFLAQISSLAERAGVRLKGFRPGQAGSSTVVSTFDVQLSLMGPYANICKLLDGLAEVPRFLTVSRFALTGPGSAGDPCVADVTISLCFAATGKRS